MKQFLKDYGAIIIVMLAPLIQHFTSNATVDALTSFAVWSVMVILLAVGVFLFGVALIFYGIADDLKGKDIESAQTIMEPFKKMKWWKTAIFISCVLSVYIYVEWPGPAVTYTAAMVLMLSSISMFKTSVIKIAKANGIAIGDETVDPDTDEATDLKKSSLL